MTKVIDIINQKKAPFASFELVPPLKGSDINKLYGAIEPLMEFAPPFINITFHRDEVEFRQTADGTFEKVTITAKKINDNKLSLCFICYVELSFSIIR